MLGTELVLPPARVVGRGPGEPGGVVRGDLGAVGPAAQLGPTAGNAAMYVEVGCLFASLGRKLCISGPSKTVQASPSDFR